MINGMSANSSRAQAAVKGMGGLVSGLDTDELVKGMTASTRSRITFKTQQKQILAWKTEAFRSISSKLTALSNKYFSFASESNMLSSKFFTSSQIEIIGGSSEEISVSGPSEVANQLTISQVNSVASKASASSAKQVGITNIASKAQDFSTPEAVADFNSKIQGKTLSFNLNGVSKTVLFAADKSYASLAEFADEVNLQLSGAYGPGRINVGVDATNSLTLATASNTASLSITSGSPELLGTEGLLGFNLGATNRPSTNLALTNLNLQTALTTGQQNFTVKINGQDFVFDKEQDSITSIIQKINESSTGLKVSYSSMTNSFSMLATETGNHTKMEISDVSGNLAASLFGEKDLDYTVTAGKNSNLDIIYGGKTLNIDRSSQAIQIDGLSINLTEKALGKSDITFSAKPNTDAILTTMKGFIEDYNAALLDLNNQVMTYKTRDEKGYKPLSPEERAEMTPEEITAWETVAKKGLLFSDPELLGLKNSLRSAMMGLVPNVGLAADIGIMSGISLKDGGKLVLDETKFKNALLEQPEKVIQMFQKPKDESLKLSDPAGYNQQCGIVHRLKATLDQYVATTGVKGLLIQKAGLDNSISSMDNTIFKQMGMLDQDIYKLNDKLKTEETRYYNQFTSLETYINRMNMQSSWLSQQFSS